jgi:hydrogenase maturation protease
MREANAMGKHLVDAATSILVIGIGNEYRSDDGLGVYVARELRHRLPESVRVIEASGEGTALMAAWRGSAHVVIIDAVSSNEPTGAMHRLDAIHETIPKNIFASSSHQFGVAEAVAMAKELNELPVTLTLYGIEAESFEPGIGLSESVVRSVPDVIHLIEHDMRMIAEGRTVKD